MTEIYKQTAEYARDHGEREAYRASLRANEACKEAIEEAIRKGFDGMYLQKEAAHFVIQQFGLERVEYVLANTVQLKKWDGRFSADNKSWAEDFQIPGDRRQGDEHRFDYEVSSHPVVLDGFIKQVRNEEKSIQKKTMVEKIRESSVQKREKPHRKRQEMEL